MAVSFTTHGSGTVTPAPTPIVSLSAQLAFKAQIRVDSLWAITKTNSMGLFQIDANGAGSLKKVEALIDPDTSTGTTVRLRITSPGLGGSQTAFVSKSALPPSGSNNDIVCYGHWNQTNFNQSLAMFDATGGLIISASNGVNDGNLPVTGSNGILTINAAWDGATEANIFSGFALYSSSQPAASWSLAPHTGEATLVYLVKLSEYASGSTNTPASASVGQTGMTLASAGNFVWINGAADSWFPPLSVVSSCSISPLTGSVSISSSGFFAGYYGAFTGTITDQFGDPQSGIVLWSTGAPNIFVNVSGTVTASNSGSATITASISGTAITASAYVVISEYDWFSSNVGVATVDVTGTFTYKSFGNAVITASRHGTSAVGYGFITGSNTANILLSSIVISSSVEGVSVTALSGSGGGGGGGFPNLPAGMFTVVNTGIMTGSPSTTNGGEWTVNGTTLVNLSPNTPSDVGEWAGNISTVPGGTGVRITYPTSLTGGNSPVRVQVTPGYASLGGVGTGYYYISWRVRFTGQSAGWIGIDDGNGTKMCDLKTVPNWDDLSDPENHILMNYPIATSNAIYQPMIGLQNNSVDQFANLVTNVNTSTGIITDGQWHQYEFLATPESAPGNGDGGCFAWIDNVQHVNYTNVKWLQPGQDIGWGGWLMDPTWGGGTTSPTYNQYFDWDQLYCALK
jgi:hypothetical protein